MVMVMVMVMVADFYISLAAEHLRLEVASLVTVCGGALSPPPPSISPRKCNSMWILATVYILGTELPRTDRPLAHRIVASCNLHTRLSGSGSRHACHVYC